MKKTALMLMQCITLAAFIIIALACASEQSMTTTAGSNGGSSTGTSTANDNGAQLIIDHESDALDADGDYALR